MDDYIIRDEAMSLPVLPKEQRIQLDNVDEAFEEGWRQALENLAILPAADVAPVRHGWWIEQPLDFDLCGVAYYQCSECGKEQQTPSNYCQFCGAKMNGGKHMNNKECKNIIQYENGKWVPAEPIPYYPPKKRSFKEIVVSTIRILLGKDGGQDDV